MTEKISTLGYSLLGFLVTEPLSGYDLSRRLAEPVTHFWNAQRSHIYPELARLESGGLVRHQRIEQRDRPDKKVYTITHTGLDAVQGWITQTPGRAPARDELVLKAYFLSIADPHEAILLFREEGRRHREQLSVYQQRLAQQLGTRESEPFQSPHFGNFLALKRGIGYECEYAEWCNFVADEIERQTTRMKSSCTGTGETVSD